MRLHVSPWGLQPRLVVRISGGRSDDVIGLLICSPVVADSRARQEALLTPDCLSRGRFSELMRARVRPIEKSRCSLGNLVAKNRKNRTTSLGEGIGWVC